MAQGMVVMGSSQRRGRCHGAWSLVCDVAGPKGATVRLDSILFLGSLVWARGQAFFFFSFRIVLLDHKGTIAS